VRADIEKYLGAVERSTAKTIAERVGIDQLEISRELNRMIQDGLVEREKRKGGNEYVYWLMGRAPVAPPTDKVDAGITITNSGTGTGAKAVLVEPNISAGHAVKVAEPEVFDAPEFREVDRPLSELYALIGVDPSITDIPVWHAIEMVRGLKVIGDACLESKAKLDAQVTTLQSDLAKARAEAESQKEVIAKLRENTAALERSIDDLTGVADVELPKVYVTVGKYVKPKRHADLPRAQRRAATLVRTEKESEVLVCAPVGRMVRGSEWKSQ
jgi:hypothetical protein